MQQTIPSTSVPVLDLPALRARQSLHPRLVLVEALGPSYYAAGHLPGAVNVPHEAPAADVHATLPDRTAEIVVYCASETCPNSHLLAARLRRDGYQNVAVFGGGKAAWSEAHLPFVT